MSDTAAAGAGEAGPPAYRVLARKYRPQSFDDLIGQDAMVRTLSNALAMGRVAHAFVLTGVRGVGKTTTARIIAKGLNCVGPDGEGGPTMQPCGACRNCRDITGDRHVDVLEMDAASRTGVDDIRELIDGVRYRPVAARYKIYIIDEVHMLSRNAFNALLKTLEEPPEHVKFIFATTEIRRVPVTVLSRCQRFDLKRLDSDELVGLFTRICAAETVEAEAPALAVIARAADGSARDGLSLLDQAMALASDGVTEALVLDMLGLADRGAVFDLFEAVMRGDVPAALDRLAAMYRAGADPVAVTQDLLDLTHLVTRFRTVPKAAGRGASQIERERGGALAAALSVPVLARAWQILLKGLEEVQRAPGPLAALEMVLIRLAHTGDLPTPAELARRIGAAASRPDAGRPAPASRDPAPGRSPRSAAAAEAAAEEAVPATEEAAPAPGPVMAAPPPPSSPAPPVPPPADSGPLESPRDFEAVIALCESRREPVLQAHLVQFARLAAFAPGAIRLALDPGAPPDLPRRLAGCLTQWTGQPWRVDQIDGPEALTAPTVAEQRQAAERARRQAAAAHPVVAAVLETFPGAQIETIRAKPAETDSDNDSDSDDGREAARQSM